MTQPIDRLAKALYEVFGTPELTPFMEPPIPWDMIPMSQSESWYVKAQIVRSRCRDETEDAK